MMRLRKKLYSIYKTVFVIRSYCHFNKESLSTKNYKVLLGQTWWRI